MPSSSVEVASWIVPQLEGSALRGFFVLRSVIIMQHAAAL